MTIYTIGYEGVNIDAFVKCLQGNGVKVLADVRQSPFSRKPGFSQKKLKEKVDSLGIVYKHFPTLGCPVKIRDAYSQNADWNFYCKHYKLHLEDHPEAIEEIAVYVRHFSCALMCFEANPNACHRSLIANVVVQRYPDVDFQNLFPMSIDPINVGQLTPCFA